MQITINTDTDDLPAVIRMLQAYGGRQATTALVADVKELSQEAESAVRPSGVDKSGPDHKIEIPGTPADQIYTGAALQAAVLPPCSAHAQEDDEPAPKSLFDAPLPPCDQTEKEGEATGVHRTALSDVTVDAAGLPWDERIHSGAKSKLANGNWKLRRGVDPAQVASVEAELRGDPKPPVAPPPPVTAPATSTPAPVAPSAPPTPPAPATPKPITNAAELVAAVMDKRFTTDQVNAACQAVGVENVASLLAKQDKLPEVLRELGV